jgi:MFS family permease
MTTFAEGAERNRALGIWGAASGSGAAAGVLLGGFLTSYLSWPWVFFINVPVGLAVIAAAPFVLAESRGQTDHRHFDVAGAVSVTAGLMMLVYAMTRATQDGWGSAATVSLLVGSGALIAAFLAIELRSPAPLLPLRIFRLRSVTAANAAAVMVGSIAFSQFFLQTLYMQDVLGYSAIRTGVGFATMAFTIIVVSNVAQRLVTRVGARPVLTAGLLLDSVSLALFTQLPVDGHYFWNLFPGMVIGGIGRCLRPHQHQPPGRRRGGPGGCLDDRLVLRRDRLGRGCERRPDPGLPDRVPRAFADRPRGCGDHGGHARTAARPG